MSRESMPAGPGRPKGGHNKITGDIKSIIKRILEYIESDHITIPSLIEELWEKDPRTILNFIAKVSPRNLDITIDNSGEEKVDISKLTKDELKVYIMLREKIMIKEDK